MTDCPECQRLIDSTGWALVGACASVGIEEGMSTGQMAQAWLALKHADHSGGSSPPNGGIS